MISKLKSIHSVTVKFLVVGLIGFMANYSVLHTLAEKFDLNRILAEIVAIAIALQITFLLHDRWTYNDEDTKKRDGALKVPLRSRYALYIASNSFSSSTTIVAFSLLTVIMNSNLAALLLSSVIQTTWNYVFNRLVIWRHQGLEQIT